MKQTLLVPPHPLEKRVLTRRFEYPRTEPVWIDEYLQTGGYEAIRKALSMEPEAIVEEVKKSALRGRGGAGFPTGMKWSFVDRRSPKPKYVVVNADEGEPGTCKDRILMGYDPHRLIEGVLIGARAIGACRGWIYIRGEYREYIEIMDRAIEQAYERGFLGPSVMGSGWEFHLSTHTGAGSYECGEETALLESLEGKRGNPRLKPPFPATSGAFQCPTILNNVETFCAVPDIILNGGEWYASLGTPRNGGTRLVCLSGHIERPGVYEVPLGHEPADDHQRDRRWRLEGPEAQGGDPWRELFAGAEGRRVRHPGRLRLAGQGRLHARLRGDHRARRDRRHDKGAGAADEVLRA